MKKIDKHSDHQVLLVTMTLYTIAYFSLISLAVLAVPTLKETFGAHPMPVAAMLSFGIVTALRITRSKVVVLIAQRHDQLN